jgi:hypothetical protein
MEFRCNATPNAVPCVHVATHNDKGERLSKPKRTLKVVKNGASVYSWIDPCSRKHFTAVDAEAKQLNADDYNKMFKKLSDILRPHGKSVPKGTPFSVLADSLAKIEYDNNQKKAAKKPELLTVPVGEPVLPEPVIAPIASVEPEVVELTSCSCKQGST